MVTHVLKGVLNPQKSCSLLTKYSLGILIITIKRKTINRCENKNDWTPTENTDTAITIIRLQLLLLELCNHLAIR